MFNFKKKSRRINKEIRTKTSKDKPKQKEEVYVIVNPLFPKYVKIGRTKDYKQRKAELNHIYPVNNKLLYLFRYCYRGKLDEKHKLEKRLHRLFQEQGKRVNPKREYFELKPEDFETIKSFSKKCGFECCYSADNLELVFRACKSVKIGFFNTPTEFIEWFEQLEKWINGIDDYNNRVEYEQMCLEAGYLPSDDYENIIDYGTAIDTLVENTCEFIDDEDSDIISDKLLNWVFSEVPELEFRIGEITEERWLYDDEKDS